MIEMINRATGTTMWVAEERKEEYLAAGHELAAKPSPTVEKERKTKEKKK